MLLHRTNVEISSVDIDLDKSICVMVLFYKVNEKDILLLES
jgi:hypothetical protein